MYNEQIFSALIYKNKINVNNFHKEETLGTKETFSVSLFIPALNRYLSTAVTHLFSLSLSLLQLSLSHRLCSTERKIWVTI